MGGQFIKTPLGNEKKLLGCTSGHVEPAGRASVELVRTLNGDILSSRSVDEV